MRHSRKSTLKSRLNDFCQLFSCMQTDLNGMGDGSHSSVQLSDIKYRERTFVRMPQQPPLHPHDLAVNGFYYTSVADRIKCYGCNLVTMSSCFNNMNELNELHMNREPSCQYVGRTSDTDDSSSENGDDVSGSYQPPVSQQQTPILVNEIETQNAPAMTQSVSPVVAQPGPSRQAQPSSSSNSSRSQDMPRTVVDGPRRPYSMKGFHTFDSLKFERERLMTYIDWPLTWLNPASLAKEGLYYLRDKDHVSCVFCRGIIGSWEPGDIPKHEHKRHFPNCSFVNKQAVGNVPLALGDLLYNLVPLTPASSDSGKVSSTSSQDQLKKLDPKDATKLNPFPGLPMYSPPKRSEYITYESRLKSYVNWPLKVKQDPTKLAEAGFFHCGLSDHVRCYHCGQGLRNWEETDDPWAEHARWYPDCDFVMVTKGIEFIDTVRRENPPFIANQLPGNKSKSQQCSSLNYPDRKVVIEDSQLDRLLNLDVMQAVANMGFPVRAMKLALKKKIETTGLPYFSLEGCVQQVLTIAIQLENEEEAQSMQNSKISRYNGEVSRPYREYHGYGGPTINRFENGSDESSIGSDSDSNIGQQDLSSPVDIVEFPHQVRTASRSYSSQTSGTSSLGSDSSDDEHTPPTILENRNIAENGESILDATLSSTASSSEIESLGSLSDASSNRGPVDIVEFPLVRGYSIPSYSTQTSGTSSIGSDSIDEQQQQSVADSSHHDDPNTTSTPRVSPAVQMFETNLPPLNQAPSSSSSGYGTLPSSGPSSSSSEDHEVVENENSQEMINQIDEVISRAEIEKRKVMKILSNGTCPKKHLSHDATEQKTSNESTEDRENKDSEKVETPQEKSETFKEQFLESKQRVTELEKEIERLKDMRTCRVCMDQEMSLVFLPCLHMATCATCGVSVSACPICRADIVHIIRPNIVA